MLWKLLVAFTIIPIVELYGLIEVGSVIGTPATIALVIITGFAGAYLARLQGAQTMLRVRHNLQQGIVPTSELIDALMIFIAGIVLITPGFLTDACGLLLLLPLTRRYLKVFLNKKINQWIMTHEIHINRYQ